MLRPIGPSCFAMLVPTIQLDPWRAVVQLCWEHGLGVVGQEEGCEACRPVRCRLKALEYGGEFSHPSPDELLEFVIDTRLKAL